MRESARLRIRRHRPGDIGWLIAEHGRVYVGDLGWDPSFEGFVAQVAARFLKRHDPAREACWIAELAGEPVGAIMLVRQAPPRTAQLRLFVVAPEARRRGIGKRLIARCLAFARQAGYRKVMLWTQKSLGAARRLYKKAGFRLVREEPCRAWGRVHTGQVWELIL
jgi:ribosomal protein S18 acetylase RimI-like enzyme